MLGVGVAPEFEGSDNCEIVPVPAAVLATRHFLLSLEGLKLRSDIAPLVLGETDWSFGPLVNFRPGRDEVEDEAVDRQAAIDHAFEAGAAVGYATPLGRANGDEAPLGANLFFDVADAHGGYVVDLSTGYAFQATDALRLGVILDASIADGGYMDTYFSVSRAGSVESGLAAYEAGGGLRKVGVELNATYDIGECWGAVGIASYWRLVGDAADGSIVEDAGSADPFFGALGVYRRF